MGTIPNVNIYHGYSGVKMKSSGDIRSDDGGNQLCYICQFDCDNIFTPNYTCPENVSLNAPEGYHLHGGKFYKYHAVSATLDQAQTTCNNEGATLSVFRNESDYLALKNLMSMFDVLLSQKTLHYCAVS